MGGGVDGEVGDGGIEGEEDEDNDDEEEKRKGRAEIEASGTFC